MRDQTRGLFQVTLIAGGLTFIAYNFQGMNPTPQDTKRSVDDSSLTKLVGFYADQAGNADGQTTDDEWAAAYKHLGAEYESLHIVPLTTEQKNKYLRDHATALPALDMTFMY